MIRKRNVDKRAIQNSRVGSDAPKNGYLYEDFKGPFVISAQGGGAAAGATGTINILQFGHNRLRQFVLGAGQTIFNPPIVAGGLDIGGDQTSTEGFEYSAGIDVRQETVFTIGTDGPFFVECILTPADISGFNPLVIGFRKIQASQTALNTYTDFGVVGVVTAADPGVIKTVSDNDNAGEVTTDTGLTWADGARKVLRVRVQGNGVIEYYVNGTRVNANLTDAFDATDQVVPFLYFLHAADVGGTLVWEKFECGLEKE